MLRLGFACFLQVALFSVAKGMFDPNRNMGTAAAGASTPSTPSTFLSMSEISKVHSQTPRSSHLAPVGSTLEPPKKFHKRVSDIVSQRWHELQHMQFFDGVLAFMKAMSFGLVVATVCCFRLWQAQVKRTTEATDAMWSAFAYENCKQLKDNAKAKCASTCDMQVDRLQKTEVIDRSDTGTESDGEDSCIYECSVAESFDVPVCQACASLAPQMCSTCADDLEELREPVTAAPAISKNEPMLSAAEGKAGETPKASVLVNSKGAATQMDIDYGPAAAALLPADDTPQKS